MSIANLSRQLVEAVKETVLERRKDDATLFANSSEAIVKYFHIEVGVQTELLAQLVKKIEAENDLVERPLTPKLAPKE